MKFKKVTENTIGNDYVIGDIHGCYDLLMAKLKEIKFDFEKDRLFSVGDLVNKGDQSLKVLGLIKEKWFFPVIGNHELIVIENFRYGRYPFHLSEYGGEWFLNLNHYDKEAIVERLEAIPVAIEIPINGKKVGIVHAEVPDHDWSFFKDELENMKDTDNEIVSDALWSRTKIKVQNDRNVRDIDYVFVGHTILPKPVKLGNVFYIDTGAFKSLNLTVMNMRDLVK